MIIPVHGSLSCTHVQPACTLWAYASPPNAAPDSATATSGRQICRTIFHCSITNASLPATVVSFAHGLWQRSIDASAPHKGHVPCICRDAQTSPRLAFTHMALLLINRQM